MFQDNEWDAPPAEEPEGRGAGSASQALRLPAAAAEGQATMKRHVSCRANCTLRVVREMKTQEDGVFPVQR